MTIQEREINILSYLLRYKYMNSYQIKRIFFAGQTNANMHRILKKLQEIGFLERIRYPSTPNTNLGSLLYLTQKGANFLAAEWRVQRDELGYKRITKPLQSINHVYHRIRLVDFWIRLDEEINKSDIELKYIATEYHKEPKGDLFFARTTIMTKDKTHKLIPDICFILKNEVKGTEVVFFVEIDTGKETIMGRFHASRPGSLLHKYQTYERILVDGGWKDGLDTKAQAFLVLTITEKANHVQTIRNRCKPKLQYPHLFLLSTHEMIEDNGILFALPWDRMDGKASSILIKR